MKYWLVKSEPETWSWTQQKKAQTTHWDGVRNYQASNNLKEMSKGDLAYFYHSGDDKKIVGIVKVVKEYYPDPSDENGRFGMVDVEYVEDLPNGMSLADMKEKPELSHLALIRQSRLSVMPIDETAWQIIYKRSQRA
jgi:predicted RNA-binding protein with PUA-like domain